MQGVREEWPESRMVSHWQVARPVVLALGALAAAAVHVGLEAVLDRVFAAAARGRADGLGEADEEVGQQGEGRGLEVVRRARRHCHHQLREPSDFVREGA